MIRIDCFSDDVYIVESALWMPAKGLVTPNESGSKKRKISLMFVIFSLAVCFPWCEWEITIDL